MTSRQQYIETLIKLVELNEDDTWNETFRKLRTGGYLPGGGAGSLNDWGPVFSGKYRSVWYSRLYEILRFLFDNDFAATSLAEFPGIKTRHNFRIIRCLKCGGRYQHPAAFEASVALECYSGLVPGFVEEARLVEILEGSNSFDGSAAAEYREWLKTQYKNLGIRIYDFVAAKYECPHCSNRDFGTEHDLFQLSEESPGNRQFGLKKQNAGWNDFQSA